MRIHRAHILTLISVLLISLFCLAGCSRRATPISVNPEDNTPPTVEIVASSAIYSDDRTPVPEPIDPDRSITIPGDPAGITVRAIDFESAIDFIEIQYNLLLRTGCLAGNTSWSSDGRILSTSNPTNTPTPIPLWAASSLLTREGIFSAVCNTDRPIPGTTGRIAANPEVNYRACACNRSSGFGDCDSPGNKCTTVYGEAIFQGMQGSVR